LSSCKACASLSGRGWDGFEKPQGPEQQRGKRKKKENLKRDM